MSNKGKENKANAVPTRDATDSLFAAAWGWNGTSRAGNNTADELRSPRQVQHSKEVNYINCAAGKHHNLLVTTDGNVFSFGENIKDQLGYGSAFSKISVKGVVCNYQAFPRNITPSGSYEFKHDVKITEVAAGSSFSVAREQSPIEGINSIVGFRELLATITKLIKVYPESIQVQKTYSIVRHELFNILKNSKGHLLAWGSGPLGQLGLGEYILHSPYAQSISSLRGVVITQVASGDNHVLAVDSNGFVYSWGQGKNGKLGHGDFEARNAPTKIKFFEKVYVLSVSAGDEHSAVVTINRVKTAAGLSTVNKGGVSNGAISGTKITQIIEIGAPKGTLSNEMKILNAEGDTVEKARVSTFGRGAHGRLGNGFNKNMNSPVLVTWRLPSLNPCQVVAVSCGGAHTLVLMSKPVPISLANPFGVQTYVVAFGFGTNGQLGDGFQCDSFVPVRSKMPKCVVITEVSAGRSWSLCRSLDGSLYSFGKGLRGQLGQEAARFSLVPRKVDCFGSFVRISAGYSHNLSIVVPKKVLSLARIERYVSTFRQFNPFDSTTEFVSCTLRKEDNKSSYLFDCCRRVTNMPVMPVTPASAIAITGSVVAHIADGGTVPTKPSISSPSSKGGGKSYMNTTQSSKNNIKPHTPNSSSGAHQLANRPTNINTSAVPVATTPVHSALDTKMKQRYYCATCQLFYICLPCVRLCHIKHRVFEIDFKTMTSPLSRPIPHKNMAVLTASASNDAEMAARTQEVLRHDSFAYRYTHDVNLIGYRMKYPGRVEDYNECLPCVLPPHYKTISSHVVDILLHDIRAANAKKATPQSVKKVQKGQFIGKSPSKQRANKSPTITPKKALPTANGTPNAATSSSSTPKHVSINTPPRPLIPACRCGLFSTCCRLIPVIPEGVEPSQRERERGEGQSVSSSPTKGQHTDISVQSNNSNATTNSKSKRRSLVHPDDQRAAKEISKRQKRENAAAGKIQNLMVSYLRHKTMLRNRKEFAVMRREVCRQFYLKGILGPIWGKLHRAYADFREEKEKAAMLYEDELMHKFVYYNKLQSGIIGVSALYFGVREFFGGISAMLPRVRDGVADSEQWRPTFAFSFHSVREQQLRLHPLRRINTMDMALLTQHLPRFSQPGYYEESRYFDLDMQVFTTCHLRDAKTERFNLRQTRLAAERQEKMRLMAEIALERLNKVRNATKNAIEKAKNIRTLIAPKPPSRPVPNHILVANKWREKVERKERARQEILAQELREDMPFSILPEMTTSENGTMVVAKKGKSVEQAVKVVRRRHSLSDPSGLYGRLREMRSNIYLNAYCKRRPSLPIKMSYLHTKEIISSESLLNTQNSVKQIFKSLSLYELRLNLTLSVQDAFLKFEAAADLSSDNEAKVLLHREKLTKRLTWRVKRLTKQVPVNNNLPLEIRSMLVQNHRNMERRNTIAEPERLKKQLDMILKMREKYSELVPTIHGKLGLSRRRRSFDFVEAQELCSGVTEMLGYDFEMPPQMITGTGLRQDSILMEEHMIKCGYCEPSVAYVEYKYRQAEKAAGTKASLFAASKQNAGSMKSRGSNAGSKTGPGRGRLSTMHSSKVTFNRRQSSVKSGLTSAATPEEEEEDFEQSDDGDRTEIYQEYYSEDGTVYYYNKDTGESVWEMPYSYRMERDSGVEQTVEVQIETQYQDEQYNWYWYNNVTRESYYS